MTDATPRTTSESLKITGPAGELEAIVDAPEGADEARIAVICHPHPLHGGTMTNKVAHMLAKAFNAAGMRAVRFNFRGVGKSEREYAHGIGETDDTFAVMDWASKRWPDAAPVLAGFSFGGAVAIRAASERPVSRLITVAPAVDRVDVPTARLPQSAWLVVQGDQDDVVDPQQVQDWIDALPIQPELVLLPGVGHYFHGRLNDLKNVVVDWLKRHGA